MPQYSFNHTGSIDLNNISKCVCTLSINNWPRRNSFNSVMMAQFSDLLLKLAKYNKCTAIIMSGHNRVFCSGADLSFAKNNFDSPDVGYLYCQFMTSNLNRYKALPFLKVCALEGDAMGGGAEVVLASDLIVMKSSAKLGFVHIRNGVVLGWGASHRLVDRCGPTVALDLVLSGRMCGANEALDLKLVDQIVDANDNIIDCCLNIIRNRVKQS